jgi:hypothetical protein
VHLVSRRYSATSTLRCVRLSRSALAWARPKKLSHEELLEYEALLLKITAPDQIVETTALPGRYGA